MGRFLFVANLHIALRVLQIMSWAAYCNFPSAPSGCIMGPDGTPWGQKGNAFGDKGKNAKIAKAAVGGFVSAGGSKFMLVNKAEGCTFGVSGDNCIVINNLSKCTLAGVGPKGLQGKLISEVNQFAAALKKGGY